MSFILSFSFLSFFSCKSDSQKTVAEGVRLQDVTLEEVVEIMKTEEDLVVIDIRTPEEISEGKIQTSALEIDYYDDDFREQLNELSKDSKYLIYCRSGKRGAKALKIMGEEGFTDVRNLLGGYNGWVDLEKN